MGNRTFSKIIVHSFGSLHASSGDRSDLCSDEKAS